MSKFCHFGQILEVCVIFWKFKPTFKKLGKFSLLWMDKHKKINRAIWSHCSPLSHLPSGKAVWSKIAKKIFPKNFWFVKSSENWLPVFSIFSFKVLSIFQIKNIIKKITNTNRIFSSNITMFNNFNSLVSCFVIF